MRTALVCFALAAGAALGGAEHPGKAIFDRTCKSCHGPEGKGNVATDKFYQFKLPRLNSNYVQGKPDSELREIVTKGRRKMDSVDPNKPIGKHAVPEQWVDDVISYVRTLKK